MPTTFGEFEQRILDADAKGAAGKDDREKANAALRAAEAKIAEAAKEGDAARPAFAAVLKKAGKVYVSDGKVYWAAADGGLVSDTHAKPETPAPEDDKPITFGAAGP